MDRTHAIQAVRQHYGPQAFSHFATIERGRCVGFVLVPDLRRYDAEDTHTVALAPTWTQAVQYATEASSLGDAIAAQTLRTECTERRNGKARRTARRAAVHARLEAYRLTSGRAA